MTRDAIPLGTFKVRLFKSRESALNPQIIAFLRECSFLGTRFWDRGGKSVMSLHGPRVSALE